MDSIIECLADNPVIAAVRDEMFAEALDSPSEVIFLLNANIMTVKSAIDKIHSVGKKAFVHIDLADGIGKDRAGVEFLVSCGVDGIISTRTGIIKTANEKNISTVQRIFALDSQGVSGIGEVVKSASPDYVEIMPGVALKVIEKVSALKIPVIAGGLIEQKSEVISALTAGALAVSTGKKELWYL